MNHFFRRILYALVLLFSAGFLHCGSTLPHRGTDRLISSSRMDHKYINAIMQQAKAAEIKSFMNENIDPCNDFYEFACGNWPRINQADSNHLTTGLFERLSDAFDRKVMQELNNKHDEFDTPEVSQVKDFYKSCIRLTSIDESYRKGLKDLIKEFGSMPVLEGVHWNDTNFDWLNTTARITYRYGFNIILGIEITKDLVNNKINAVYIIQQDFPLESRGMYLDKKTEIYRTKFTQLMAKKLHTFLGVDEELASRTAKELMDFEVELAKGLMDDGVDVDLLSITKPRTMNETQRIYPTLNIKHLVDISIGEGIKNVTDFCPKYKENLVNVIRATPKRTLANYIFYRLVDEFTYDLGKTETKRKQNCLDTTREYFSKLLDNMIYRKYNNEATATDIQLMWTEIKETFKQKLQSDSSLNWISNRTREFAIKKLQAMKFQINSYADEDMSKDFKDMHLQDESYIDNLKNLYRVQITQMRDLLNQPVKPLELSETLSFTPANILLENVIKVPVAVLQPYYIWAASYPKAIKFGALASLIGHELIHGFDSQGRKFDEVGNINDWWDEESTSNFMDRFSCFTKQYSNYSYNGHMLPETDAQSENIADNGGVRLAYDAYLRWQNSHNKSSDNEEDSKQLSNEKLPTLKYTNIQLFFISYAQIWCNDVHPRIRNVQVATDDHVPGKFRVIGPLANFDEFAKEFQCKVGTQMNPAKKCKLY